MNGYFRRNSVARVLAPALEQLARSVASAPTITAAAPKDAPLMDYVKQFDTELSCCEEAAEKLISRLMARLTPEADASERAVMAALASKKKPEWSVTWEFPGCISVRVSGARTIDVTCDGGVWRAMLEVHTVWGRENGSNYGFELGKIEQPAEVADALVREIVARGY